MANEAMRVSSRGMAELRAREGAIMHYYDDPAGNCTYGVGTLVHRGPCTAQERATPVTATEVDQQLAIRTQAATAAVRRRVTQSTLTQAQFDALVSYTYNVGAGGARSVLDAANAGDNVQVARRMEQTVYVHPVDPNGRPLPARRVPGLVSRRQDEAAPFRNPPAGRQP